ncbi:MAG: type II toxin-antitoxin system PemK/MazF family toxin [Defluviitaleaceae bacterium]|nr:type II toxin-antitoxin system PemK/MazF family toxin [Defluviitaleaceae bacterium]
MIKPYSLHIAYVSWGIEGKLRPVLVLSSNKKEVTAFQITSQYENKSKAVQAQYIPIDNWAEAGLSKKSYINISKIIHLPTVAVKPAQIGKLSEEDLHKLLAAMSN